MAGVILIADRLAAARHLHQVHPLSGDGRLHRRHRRDHLRQPARAICSGLTLAGKEPGEFVPKLEALAAAPADASILRRSPVAVAQHRHHRWPAALAAALAGHADRGRARRGRDGRAARCRSRPSARGSAAFRAACRRPRCRRSRWRRCMAVLPDAHRLRAARRDRVAAVGGGRRRHDRPPPPLQLRTGGAGRRQYRLGAVRRHLRHRHHRAHRDQRPRRRARAARRACCTRSSCCCSCWWPRRSRATSRSPRLPACSPSSPGTWRRSTSSRRCCAPRCGDAVVLLATFLLTDLPRPDRRHPGRLRARRAAVHAPHGGDDGHRGALAAGGRRSCR